MLTKSAKDVLIIIFSTLLLTFLVWLPHLLNINNFYRLDFSPGFNTIIRNYDGLNYVVIAKSFYNPEIIASIPFTLSPNYYAAHFPGYSILILIFSPFLGFIKAMLFVPLLFTIFSAIAFYFLVKNFKLTQHPLVLSIIFLILPARWLIVHSVGSSEPIFIFFIIMAMYFFMKFEETSKWQDIVLTGLFGMFAQITRPPGVLFFISLCLYVLFKIIKESKHNNFFKVFFKNLKYFPLIFIPLGLFLVFWWYQISYNNFFAYFNSGDNIHLEFPPFQVFNINQYWVGDMWLEDIVYILIFGYLGAIYLFKQKNYPMGFFVLTYFIASSLVAHRDISRYTLPTFPFILIAFQKVLVSKEFRIVLIILFLAIYLYSQNYIINNTAPIPNLESYN